MLGITSKIQPSTNLVIYRPAIYRANFPTGRGNFFEFFRQLYDGINVDMSS